MRPVCLKPVATLLRLLITAIFIGHTSYAVAATAKDIAEDFDNYFVPIFPTVYGEIINTLPADEVANISTVLRGLEFFGYLKSLGDVANAIDSGNNTEAAIETASTVAKMIVSYGQYKGAAGFAVMGTSVGFLPVTALITAIDVARSSQKAVAASKVALDLEKLYGSVEYDREIKDTNRKLGEGDPIKVTSTSIDRLWRRVITDPSWGDLFKNYVVSELGETWPEPSLWDRLSIPAEVRREALLYEQEKRLKSHIATLLLELNKVAQKREAEVVLAKQMREMSALALKIDPAQFKDALSLYRDAMILLPSIQAYTAELPETVKKYEERFAEARDLKVFDYKKKYGKEPSIGLAELRFQILEESQTILRHAKTLRAIPPNDKKAGGERDRILTALKLNYLKLWPMRDSISTQVVNAKLIADTEAMTLAQTEFTFTRHPPEKGFDEYAKDFIEPVRKGSPDAMDRVGRAESALTSDQAKTRELYKADWLANINKRNEKNTEFDSQIKALSDSLATTKDSRQRDELRQRIYELGQQKIALQQRWERYDSIHRLNAEIDNRHFDEVLREIRQFVQTNNDHYGKTWQAIETHHRDATQKRYDFYRMRQSNSRHPSAFLGREELEHLREMIRRNTGGYIGINAKFLEQHLPTGAEEEARSTVIAQTINKMQKEIWDQMGKIYQFRMEYYPNWEIYTLPSLKYMASSEARAEIKNLVDSHETALKFLRNISPQDIQPPRQDALKSMIQDLEGGKLQAQELSQLTAEAASLAGLLENYLPRAFKNNEMIAEDGRFLSSLYVEFQPASSQLSALLGSFRANNYSFLAMAGSSNSVPPKVLASTAIKDILNYRGILQYSAQAGLGLEELLKTPFAELPITGGTISLTPDYLNSLSARIDALPKASYAVYQPAMQKILDESQAHAILFRFAQIEAFQTQFSFDAQLSSAIKQLAKAISDAIETASKNQNALDAESNRFLAVLQKLNSGITLAQNAIAAQNWGSAASLEHFHNETLGEYAQLGKTRKDVDTAFEQLRKLIEEAKSKLARTPVSSPTPVIDEAAIQSLYQEFINAYARGDIRGILRLLGPDWTGGDGADVRDVESYLGNSFRVFDRIQYRISGFSASPNPATGIIVVRYNVKIIGQHLRHNLHHEEESSIVEELGVVDGAPRILRTLSGSQWLR